jgi:hypothetical protein
MRNKIYKFISEKDNPTIEEFDKFFSPAIRDHALLCGWIQYVHGINETRVVVED